jgi:zinc transport system ATP-binding protein|tara:strand:+ start:3366 stop:4094 length:729 start_codon:yes stop_codon:yes gene_type:complete
MSFLIQAKNLSVSRQNKSILENVSLSIKKKDFITIIGPNGAGKSVLLDCLMGSFIPDRGEIIKENNLCIGYIPQNFVPENSMPICVERFLTLKKKCTTLELNKISKETNITGILKKNLSNLSGGELQKVLLTRSLLNEPELLILDEPAQNLDIKNQLNFYNLLNRIYENRKLSILMVSHDLHMVMSSTKQVVCLYHHVCCSGEPQTVAKDPEFISLFGNDMAEMMSVYQHTHNHSHQEIIND